MDLATRLLELQKRAVFHREVLLTEEAAKTALVMPFIQALGYDVFNPAEVVPEFNADVGDRKGEKVDYALFNGGAINMLIECKPSASELKFEHGRQLFRYFNVTTSRVGILTNGMRYQFYSDLDEKNIMDNQPFFTFSLDKIRDDDTAILERFTKDNFNIDDIMAEARNLQLQYLLREKLQKEFTKPSEEFVRMMARRVHKGKGNITTAIKENTEKLLISSIENIVQDLVAERLTRALTASVQIHKGNSPKEEESDEVIPTEEEMSGFRIVQAIASKIVKPSRVFIRSVKSYCAVLLDDNNRKTISRLRVNGSNIKHIGTFDGKEETRHAINDVTDIFTFSSDIERRIKELDQKI